MQLSKNFSLEEMTHSDFAVRKGIDNTPTPEQVENLRDVARVLEEVRALIACPIGVTSGFRSPKLNAAVGGSATSAHMEGRAADFRAPQYGEPLDICKAIARSEIKFDQLIYEGDWVHIAVAENMRGQVLTAHFEGGRPKYTTGIT